MDALLSIVVFGALMAVIALSGSIALLLRESTLNKVLLPMIAFAAVSLIGGAIFHMIPAAVGLMGNGTMVYVWVAAGFFLFFLMEQFLEWHHSHYPSPARKKPLTYLILIADGVHNLIGGLAIGAAFVLDFRLGLTAWLAAAAHEIPQELGDFAVLVYGRWSRARALLMNFLSGLTFLLGGVLAWAFSARADLSFLIPFAAGNFLYIGAADLIPEIKKPKSRLHGVVHVASFLVGLGVLLMIRMLAAEHT